MLFSQLMQGGQPAAQPTVQPMFNPFNMFGGQQPTVAPQAQPQAAQAPQASTDTLVDQILSNDEAIAKLKEKLGL